MAGTAALALLCALTPAAIESDPREWQPDDVAAWLMRIGLHEYRIAFRDSHVDGNRLLGLTLDKLADELLIPSAEHRLVLEMEISELRLRHSLLSPSERKAHRRAHPCIDGWPAKDVRKFLEGVGLGRYASYFLASNTDGDRLLGMTEDDLRGVMLEHRDKESLEEMEAAVDYLAAQLIVLRERSTASAGLEECHA